MAVVNLTRADGRESGTPGSQPTAQVYTSAVLLALFSFLFALAITPPMFWHARNRNIGATALHAWLILLLLFSFINAIIWPSDNIETWFNGVGLCDIEVKIQYGAQVAQPAAFACILRALAAVLDTRRTTFSQTKAQRRRTIVIDLTCCVGLPMVHMFFHYVFQTRRYYIYGISGCVPAVSPSWLSVLLLNIPPALWTIYDSYLAILISLRLYRYRTSFSAIIASSNTTKSRFIRLYLICVLWTFGTMPLEFFTVAKNIRQCTGEPYSWTAVHNPEAWAEIVMVPSHGQVLLDRWLWIAVAMVVFVFFGFGTEAVAMHRTFLLGLGLGKLIPCLRDTTADRHNPVGASLNSLSSKAKTLFTWGPSASSSRTVTQSTLTSDETSIRKETCLSTDVEQKDGHEN